MLFVFLIFFIWRIFDFLMIFLAPKFIPYAGFFPYKEILFDYHLPQFLTKLANFDGIHYLLIAQKGYSQFEQAFFPLYPLLIKIFDFFIKNSLVSALLISNIFFVLGLIFFIKYLKSFENLNNFKIILTFLVFFPASFYFGAVYTEGLFFFFLAGFLCFLKKEKYFLASVFAFFASLTRLIGLFLIIFFIFKFFEKKIKKINLFFVFSPIFGFLAYCFYLWKTTGDPLMFFHSQPAFGANRSTSLIFLPQVAWRYLKIFFTADFNFQYFIAIFEFFVFFLVLSVLLLDLKNLVSIKNLKLKIKNYDYLALNIFSFANLILPSLTGTFSSIPRYSLFSLSFFIYLRKIKNKFLKFLILLFFLIFHTILLVFFSQGYFVS